MVLLIRCCFPAALNILNSTCLACFAAIKRPYTIKEATSDWLNLLRTLWALRPVCDEAPADHAFWVNHHFPKCVAGCIGAFAFYIEPWYACSPAWRFSGEADRLESAALCDIHKESGTTSS